MLLIFEVKTFVISVPRETEKKGDFNLGFPCVCKERFFHYFLVVFDLKLFAVNLCFCYNCAKVYKCSISLVTHVRNKVTSHLDVFWLPGIYDFSESLF